MGGRRSDNSMEEVARTVWVRSRGTRVMRCERRGLENIDCADSGSHFCPYYYTGQVMWWWGTYVDVEFRPFCNIPMRIPPFSKCTTHN